MLKAALHDHCLRQDFNPDEIFLNRGVPWHLAVPETEERLVRWTNALKTIWAPILCVIISWDLSSILYTFKILQCIHMYSILRFFTIHLPWAQVLRSLPAFHRRRFICCLMSRPDLSSCPSRTLERHHPIPSHLRSAQCIAKPPAPLFLIIPGGLEQKLGTSQTKSGHQGHSAFHPRSRERHQHGPWLCQVVKIIQLSKTTVCLFMVYFLLISNQDDNELRMFNIVWDFTLSYVHLFCSSHIFSVLLVSCFWGPNIIRYPLIGPSFVSLIAHDCTICRQCKMLKFVKNQVPHGVPHGPTFRLLLWCSPMSVYSPVSVTPRLWPQFCHSELGNGPRSKHLRLWSYENYETGDSMIQHLNEFEGVRNRKKSEHIGQYRGTVQGLAANLNV